MRSNATDLAAIVAACDKANVRFRRAVRKFR